MIKLLLSDMRNENTGIVLGKVHPLCQLVKICLLRVHKVDPRYGKRLFFKAGQKLKQLLSRLVGWNNDVDFHA